MDLRYALSAAFDFELHGPLAPPLKYFLLCVFVNFKHQKPGLLHDIAVVKNAVSHPSHTLTALI
jgi:hypothetical protein